MTSSGGGTSYRIRQRGAAGGLQRGLNRVGAFEASRGVRVRFEICHRV